MTRHGEIKVAISVKVASGYGDSSAWLQRILFEILQRAVARAQQYGDRVRLAVGDGQVEYSIAVEIRRRDPPRPATRHGIDANLERAVAVAQ